MTADLGQGENVAPLQKQGGTTEHLRSVRCAGRMAAKVRGCEERD